MILDAISINNLLIKYKQFVWPSIYNFVQALQSHRNHFCRITDTPKLSTILGFRKLLWEDHNNNLYYSKMIFLHTYNNNLRSVERRHLDPSTLCHQCYQLCIPLIIFIKRSHYSLPISLFCFKSIMTDHLLFLFFFNRYKIGPFSMHKL